MISGSTHGASDDIFCVVVNVLLPREGFTLRQSQIVAK